MNILHIYPEYPHKKWTLKQAMHFVPRKPNCSPLGLLSVASLVPRDWETRLIDMNRHRLLIENILWADFVFLSATADQVQSVLYVIDRCKALLTPIVAGGPLFDANPPKFNKVDHLILNPMEITFPLFLKDLAKNNAQQTYAVEELQNINHQKSAGYSSAQQQK